MDRGGVHVSTSWQVAATWHPYPAAMHSGVLCICPAMHGGGAKRPISENTFESVSKLKFVSNLG